MRDDDLLAALRQHWAASDANDFDREHRIYRDDAILEYPQSGERIRGRQNIQASRVAQPNAKRFTLRRIVGGGNVWISELVLTYDGHRLTSSASWRSRMARSSVKPSISERHSTQGYLAFSGSSEWGLTSDGPTGTG